MSEEKIIHAWLDEWGIDAPRFGMIDKSENLYRVSALVGWRSGDDDGSNIEGLGASVVETIADFEAKADAYLKAREARELGE